jgi:hypothetical protein
MRYQSKGIKKGHDSFSEGDAMLFLVDMVLGWVPVEVYIQYIPNMVPIYSKNLC